ncbi:hypothetical protein DUZ99_02045 [Xylanibacillus composti]|uniref:Scaffold protein n=1 Tax=Xylanibacillus composti TaxID=1572762 RepID=A0A8J4H4E0_9BACL|nr:phage scaffolding protein [Xylanibacillus composti]MDT9723776.1 hypothetical protein [Xylanibacillus composti]GIQ70753.1 scaffold protein [Xylanibacillus composti]
MTKEEFIALGLSEELADKAAAASAEELKGFIPKARFDEINTAKKKAEEDLDERDKQLEQLKKDAGSNEELKKQIESLQGENKAAKEKYEAELTDLQKTTALKLKLAGKVHVNAIDDVVKLFDKEKVVIDENGNIKSGYEDQEKSLRESKGFYFIPEETEGTSGDIPIQFRGLKPAEGGDKGNGSGIVNPWKQETFNLTEQGRLLREKPELAKQLKTAAGVK